MMIYKNELISTLEVLANEELQVDAWVHRRRFLPGIGELMCQAYDDTGLAQLLDSGNANLELSVEAVKMLSELRYYLKKQRLWDLPEAEVAVSDKMLEARRLAKAAIKVL